MKKHLKPFIKSFAKGIATVWHIVFGMRMYSLIKSLYSLIYSYWICKGLKNSVGGGVLRYNHIVHYEEENISQLAINPH